MQKQKGKRREPLQSSSYSGRRKRGIKKPLTAAEAVLTYWFFCCIIEPAGSHSGRARLHSELEREFFLFQVLWLHLSSKERWTAVVPFPKGGGCYAEIHKIYYLCYSHSNSFYIKSKITAPLDKVLAVI